MGEDSDNHWRVLDSGDDLEGAATVQALVDVDFEDLFEQPGPIQAGAR